MATSTLEQSHVCLALRNSPIPVLRQLAVEETDSAVVLSGRVPSYYFKQLAQETIMRVLGNRKLLNRVTVVRELVPQG
jgi:hypothetical protein